MATTGYEKDYIFYLQKISKSLATIAYKLDELTIKLLDDRKETKEEQVTPTIGIDDTGRFTGIPLTESNIAKIKEYLAENPVQLK